jgi:hypothetical protein
VEAQVAVSLVIGGLLVLAMVGVSIYGARSLPSDVRIPIHFGLGTYNNFASRTVGLIMWPAGGAVAYGIFAGIQAGAIKPNHGGSGSAAVILPIVLAVILVTQVGAFRAARGGTSGQ